MSDGVVKIRELTWGPYPNSVLACDDVAVAGITAFGGHKYQVQRDPEASGYIAFLAPQFGSLFWKSKGHDTLEAAKAAAQADYEARIRSALVEVPAVKGEPEPVAHRKMTREEYNALNLKGWHSVRHDEECDGVTEVSYTAPPADAGMRPTTEDILECISIELSVMAESWTGGPSGLANGDDVAEYLTGTVWANLATAIDALTAPGATAESDGGWNEAIEACIQAARQTGNFGDYKREELTADYGQPKFDMMNAIINVLRALTKSDGGGESRPAISGTGGTGSLH